MPANKYFNAAGKRVPGVTTVIGSIGWNTDMLVAWANRIGREEGLSSREVSKGAADLGSMVHLAVEADLKGEPFSAADLGLSDEQKSAFHAALAGWHAWRSQVSFALVASEAKVVSEEMQCGGQIDIVAVVNDKLTLIDLKSGNRIYAEAAIQTAAYSAIWNETHPSSPIESIGLLRVDKETAGFTYTWVPVASTAIALEAFGLARRLYDLKKPVSKLVGG